MVTAVIVAHDGAAWLPHLLDALTQQTRTVQRVVAVDTGSRDRSGSVLTAQLGQGAVFGMDRACGYAMAVRRAVQHKAATAPVAGGQSGRARTDQVEWLWLLHDDCEPAPDALEQLLRGAAETPSAAVLGPKLMDWADRDVIIEAGLTLDTAGRRISGVEPREVDQGQHDGDRDALAVCSAGMLVRRDVWEQAGGFDPGMTLFGEDIDFCWRVHAAGYRVRVITDAVVYHAQAATKGRRAISVGRRARLLSRRNSLVTLLGNLPLGPMVASLVGNLTLSLVRTIFYLVAKRPSTALDESAAVLGVVGHPLRLVTARRLRARGRRAAYSRLRGDLPPGRSIRRVAEFVSTVVSRPAPEDLAGAHHATDDPTDDDFLLTDTGFLQRALTRPGVLLVLGLIVLAAAAERSVVTGGTLGGGALLPAWEGASGLWSQFLQAYHPAGIGSASAGPPYIGILALLATVLAGKAWLAIDVLLLGCVPLAGITAVLALRRVTKSVPVRVWAAAAYALLPVAFGAIAAGRLGSTVAFVLIPVIGLLAGRMFTQPPKIARRAAWATGLTVAVGAAFVPLLWPMAVAGAVVAGLTLRRSASALVRNLAIVVLTPPVLLLPWLVQLLAHPTGLLFEAGIQQSGLASPNLPARSLVLLSPGGPGLPPYWVSGAVLLTGLAALLASRRLKLIAAGWIVAVLGLAAGLAASRVTVTQADGAQVTAWPGVALAIAAAGLLLAAAAGADGLGPMLSAGGRTGLRRLISARGIPVAILALAACTAPVLAAGYWVMNGISGPLRPASGEVVPSLVSSTAGAGRQLRTLVLTSSGGHVSFLLLRGESPQFVDPDLTPAPSAQAALVKAVAALVAPGGGEAANQSQRLAGFDIGFVLMRAPLDNSLVSVLDGVAGLTGVSMTPAFDLWRLTDLPSRASVVERDGAVVALPSGSVGVSGAKVPAVGGTVLLAEPSGGWSAAVNGHAQVPVTSPAGRWAQAFTLPPGGGTLTISRNALTHDLLMALELLLFVLVAALALPGIRTAAEIEVAAAAPAGASGDEAEADLRGRRAGADAEDASDGETGEPARQGAGRPGSTTLVPRQGRARRGASARGKARGRVGRAGSRAGRSGNQDDGEILGADAGASPRPAGRRGAGVPVPPRARGRSAKGRRAAAAAERAAAAGAMGGGAAAGGAAGAGAAGTGAAAGGAVAGGVFAAGAAGGRRRAAGIAAAAGSRTGVPGAAGAAWPAGQPDSRFMSGPPDDRRPPADWRGPERTPDGRAYPADDPRAFGRHDARLEPDGRAAAEAPYGESPRRDAPSPSGMPYDEPGDLGQPASPDWYPAASEARSPSGSHYQGAAGQAESASRYGDGPGYGEDPGYAARRGYPAGPAYHDSSGYADGPGYVSRPGYADGPDYANGPGYAHEPAYAPEPGYAPDLGYAPDPGHVPNPGYTPEPAYRPDPGHVPNPGYTPEPAYRPDPGYRPDPAHGLDPRYAQRPGYARDPASHAQADYPGQAGHPGLDDYQRQDDRDPVGHGGQAASWSAGDQQSGWPAAAQQQGWRQDYQHGWPQDDQQHGWPQEGSSSGSAADPAWHATGQPPWPDQAEVLEALPPAGEVHHDWPGHEDRAARGWPAPEHEGEAEEW